MATTRLQFDVNATGGWSPDGYTWTTTDESRRGADLLAGRLIADGHPCERTEDEAGRRS